LLQGGFVDINPDEFGGLIGESSQVPPEGTADIQNAGCGFGHRLTNK
jgi:hypothetical protein